jgi:hypothetical protein
LIKKNLNKNMFFSSDKTRVLFHITTTRLAAIGQVQRDMHLLVGDGERKAVFSLSPVCAWKQTAAALAFQQPAQMDGKQQHKCVRHCTHAVFISLVTE